MKWFRALLSGVFLYGVPGAAQDCPDAAALRGSLAEPLATVRVLADDAFQGRQAGTPGERCATAYIAARFRSLGLQPAGANGTFFQDVPLASTINPHAAGGTGRNVLALLEGSDPALRDQIIVIGAHHDHLGLGGSGSLDPASRQVHNGADDNASGVAAVLRTAALLTAGPRPARSVLFMTFTGEESGLLGSAFFARSQLIPFNRLRAMINMDMVGRLQGKALIVYGVDTATEWRALLEAEAPAAGVELAMRGEGTGPSDHTSFYTSDVPVLHLFTNTHSEYHRPADDWDRIDAAGLERVATLVTGLTRRLANPATTLSLVKGAGAPVRAATRGSGAYLGTVPDFTPVARGVLLGGVTAGSPGDRAGMKKGDILIRLGSHEVKDLEEFTGALNSHKPGDEVEIVVLRGGVEVHLRAQLGRRGG